MNGTLPNFIADAVRLRIDKEERPRGLNTIDSGGSDGRSIQVASWCTPWQRERVEKGET